MKFQFKQAKLNEHVSTVLEENRQRHTDLLASEILKPDSVVVESNFNIQNIISQLLEKYRYYESKSNSGKCKEILQIGTSFFYDILNSINEDVQNWPVTEELCKDSVSQLGVC